MSFNLMELAKGALTDKIMGSIGGLLGTDAKATSGGIGAALPALIGGMMKKTSTSGGASEVFGVLDKHDGGMLGDLGGIFDGGEKQEGMLSMGQGLLKMIFGGGLSGILETIGKLSGLKSGMIGKLLSVLAPVVMGILGKQKKSAGWDIGNFTSAMASQKDHLPKMDSGLMDSLGIGSMLSSAKGVASGAVGAASDAAGAVGGAVSGGVDKAADVAAGGANMLKILLPVILLGALAFLAWKFLLPGATAGDDENKKTDDTSQVAPGGQGGQGGQGTLGLGGGGAGMAAAIPGQFTRIYDGAKAAVSDVTDVPTAEAARDKFDGFTTKLGTLTPMMGNLPEAAKTQIGEGISGFTSELPSMLDKAYNIPGVEDVLKPSVDGFLEKLGGFGK